MGVAKCCSQYRHIVQMGNKILVEMALWRIFCKAQSTGLEAACQVGLCRKELERVKGVGGRNWEGESSLEKRRGRTRLYSRWMVGLADEARSDA
jgi:hypothetical protein